MRDIALYYPWMDVRDEAWLKAAALYWPRLAVMAPLGQRRNDESRTARMLRDRLDFLIDVNPRPWRDSVGGDFLRLIERAGARLVARYGWLTNFDPGGVDGRLDRDSSVYKDKIYDMLGSQMVKAGLASWVDGYRSLAMHPRLASVYLSALADRVAQANGLVPVTDQPRHHGTLNGWTAETLAQVLLADETDERQATARTAEDVVAMYAAVAIQTVVPAGLKQVSVERVVRARRALAAEFDAFHDHLGSLADRLAEFARIEDPAILRAQMDDLVERDLRRPTADLERGLRQLRLEPMRAVLAMTSLELPVAAGWVPEAAALPVAVGAGGMVAVTLVGSSARARQQALIRRRSAAGYLLGLREELNPSGIVDRVSRMFRRVSDPPQPPRWR